MPAPTYDTTQYLDPDYPRGGVWCSVTFTARVKSPGDRYTCGAFLKGTLSSGLVQIFTADVFDIADALGISDMISEDYLPMVRDAIDVQLLEHPWAELECPLGAFRMDVRPYAQCYLPNQNPEAPSSCANCAAGEWS